MSQTAVCTVIVIDSDAQGNADYHLKLKLSVVISFVCFLRVYGTFTERVYGKGPIGE